MSRIQIALAAFIAVLIGIWFTSDSLSASATNARAQAVAFTQFTGLLSLGMMAFANLLSARPRWLEPSLDGLDKMYRLHKWLGIGGLSVGILHWLTKAGTGRRPPTAVDAAADTTQQAAQAVDAAATTSQTWLQLMQGPAHMLAEPALFLLIALVVVALVKLVPYRIFAKTHILTVLIFAYFAFHSVVLMKADYWMKPAGWLIILLSVAGSIAGIVGLFNFFGWRRVSRGKIISSHYYPELHVLEIDIELDQRWPGHQSGQFAFVTTDRFEGAHPFTIATHWNDNVRKIGFIAKELGDHTAKLRENFSVGKAASVQGPYGRFIFDDGRSRQIWVGGGIGITPFVAKMRELGEVRGKAIVDLFHSTREVSEEALSKMRADAAAAGITLHILVSPRDGMLDFVKIAAAVPDWRQASVWFCGPTAFGAALSRDFISNGLARRDFHQELFEMR